MDLVTALWVGAIQGLTEWLPVSSEAMVALALVKFLGKDLKEAVFIALGLHIGTLLAAIVYFRHHVVRLMCALMWDRGVENKESERPIAVFLAIVTGITLVLAGLFLWFGMDHINFTGAAAMALIGALLIVTGALQEIARRRKTRPHARVNLCDSFLLGVVQSLAIIPGLSRSGLTISALLFRHYEGKAALELSFLMSIPLVAVGAILLLVTGKFSLDLAAFVAAASAFIVGLLTINVLMRIASRVRFGLFCMVLGAITTLPLLIEWI